MHGKYNDYMVISELKYHGPDSQEYLKLSSDLKPGKDNGCQGDE